MPNPEIHLSCVALSAAHELGGVDAILSRTREEMDDLRRAGASECLLDIYFHTFPMKDYELIIWPGDGFMQLDLALRHPFKNG